jgi:Uma2 family endonuclease
MTTQTTLTTAEELLRMPRVQWRYELIDGELRQMSPASHDHGDMAMNIGSRIAQFVRENKLGKAYAAETGFILRRNPDTVRAPDAAYISHARLAQVRPGKGFFPGAPDLAVEVISPSDSYEEVEAKVLDWLEAGTRMVIVVNPRLRNVSVYRGRSDIRILSEHDTLDGSDVLPGWSVKVAEIFG